MKLRNSGMVFCGAAIMYAALALYYVACKFTSPGDCQFCKLSPNGCEKEETSSSDLNDENYYGNYNSFPEVTWELFPYDLSLKFAEAEKSAFQPETRDDQTL